MRLSLLPNVFGLEVFTLVIKSLNGAIFGSLKLVIRYHSVAH